ncbi:MAG: hypothetical protein ACREPU_11870 [Rhodanobacteraceae bacterium]
MLAVGLVLPSLASVVATSLPKAKVEQTVVDALPVWHGKSAQIIEYVDLTQPFATAAPWALVVAQNLGPSPAPEWTDHGPIAVCLVGGLDPRYPQCTGAYWLKNDTGVAWFVQPYRLVAARVVHAGPHKTRPLLLVQTCSVPGINGNCSIRTSLYQYVGNVNSFLRVFVHDSDGSNNNQAARFVEKGPLQGDVIVDYPTEHAPYTYWVEVYGPRKSGPYARPYARILRYRGRTGYGDRNPLPVADSEMPEILHRLGLWQPGEALPVPPRMPKNCTRLFMRQGEEWCR